MLNGAFCYCNIVILHSLFPDVTTAFPLPWLIFGIILLSIDTIHIHMVRWVLGCYCSSMMLSLCDLQLTYPNLVHIIFGLLPCLLCGMFALFVLVLSSKLGILQIFTPTLSCCVSMLIWVLSLSLLLSSLYLSLLFLMYLPWFMYMCMYRS